MLHLCWDLAPCAQPKTLGNTNIDTVYARLTARALFFSTKLTTGPLFKRALIQAQALVIFKVKLCTKIIVEDKYSKFIFKFCSHGRLFKRALNQDRAVKRAYTVLQKVIRSG